MVLDTGTYSVSVDRDIGLAVVFGDTIELGFDCGRTYSARFMKCWRHQLSPSKSYIAHI